MNILDRLPQKPPFLMIDKVLEFEPNKKVVAIKNVSKDEYYFKGHFPGNPIMPGNLIAEAMAQTAVLLLSNENNENITYYLTATNVRFLKPVKPGKQLKITVEPVKLISNAGIVKAHATVNDGVVAKGDLSFAIR